MIPSFHCQALGRQVLLQRPLKGRSSRQGVPAAARVSPQNSPTRAGRPRSSSKAPGWLLENVLLSPSLYCSPHDKRINREVSCWGQRIVSLSGKPAEQDGGPEAQRTILLSANQAPFILQGAGLKPSTSWFPAASGGEVLISPSCTHSQVRLLRRFPGG